MRGWICEKEMGKFSAMFTWRRRRKEEAGEALVENGVGGGGGGRGGGVEEVRQASIRRRSGDVRRMSMLSFYFGRERGQGFQGTGFV